MVCRRTSKCFQMMSKGRDMSMFFPDVVKNVVSQSLEVKKLVYMFLVRYAEVKQELALLAINSFQKDMADKVPTSGMAVLICSESANSCSGVACHGQHSRSRHCAAHHSSHPQMRNRFVSLCTESCSTCYPQSVQVCFPRNARDADEAALIPRTSRSLLRLSPHC